jgi:NAD(P)-dependent dehydrogenase (short-subunit alcohol dehydrogenase family)
MSEPVRADLSGKTCLVTGASAGIGKATAEALAGLGARVMMAVRDAEKGERARREIVRSAGRGDLELAIVDLASQASIRAFAAETARRLPTLDVLVNNAGVWANRKRQGPDGIELTWATNVLGYHLVTELLLPLLRRAPRARIVNVASQLAGGLDLGDVQYERRPYSGKDAYAQSKQADRMLTWALARRLSGTRVTANALHPGFVATEIFGKGGGLAAMAVSAYSKLRAKRPEEGAATVVYLAASPDVEGRSGLFWVDRQERRCRFRDDTQEEALVALCRSMAPV